MEGPGFACTRDAESTGCGGRCGVDGGAGSRVNDGPSMAKRLGERSVP